MKNEKWTEDLYLYRMKPAQPKKNDLQEYISLYRTEKDDKYLSWFLYYYEPRLNIINYANRAGKRHAGAFCRYEAGVCFWNI